MSPHSLPSVLDLSFTKIHDTDLFQHSNQTTQTTYHTGHGPNPALALPLLQSQMHLSPLCKAFLDWDIAILLLCIICILSLGKLVVHKVPFAIPHPFSQLHQGLSYFGNWWTYHQ